MRDLTVRTGMTPRALSADTAVRVPRLLAAALATGVAAWTALNAASVPSTRPKPALRATARERGRRAGRDRVALKTVIVQSPNLLIF